MSSTSTPGAEPSERRIRKHIHGKTHTFEIECAPGFTELCKRWCDQLWSESPTHAKHPECAALVKNGRLVIENAPFDYCHDLLLRGQPFTDVKIQIFRGRCSNEDKLISHLNSIPWEIWIPQDKKIAWDLRIDSLRSQLYNEKKIKLLFHKFLEQRFARPSTTEDQDIALDLNLEREVLTVSLSLGGRNFWQRKQKESLSHTAPLREDIAACLIIRMHELGVLWGLGHPPQCVLNPFCGTGTLLHESALFLAHIGNMLDQSNTWSYPHLPFYKKAAFLYREKRILNEVKQSFLESENLVTFRAEDLQPDCVSAAQEWFESTGIQNFMPHRAESKCHNSVVPHPLDGLTIPRDNGLGWIVSNPPFGIRLSNNSQGGTENLYRDFAQRIASLSNTNSSMRPIERLSWLGVVLCPNEDCWRIVQRTLSNWQQKCEHFTLGGLDIRAVYFGHVVKGAASFAARDRI